MTDKQTKQTRCRIGKLISAYRSEQGMTQQQLANNVGISREHLGRIEAGRNSVGIDILEGIAKALGKEVSLIEMGSQ